MLVNINFLRFEIQARNDEHCSTNDEHYNQVPREEKEKGLSQFSRNISYFAMKIYGNKCMRLPNIGYPLIVFTCGVIFIKLKTILRSLLGF